MKVVGQQVRYLIGILGTLGACKASDADAADKCA